MPLKYWSQVNAVIANTWVHVLGTFDYSRADNAKVGLFINGVETTCSITDKGSSPSSADDSSGTAGIGSRNTSAVFDGKIDEVRIYNRALTTTEIRQLYQMGKAVKINPDL